MRNKLRLLTPGPTHLPEKVRLALAKDMIHHRKPEFESIMKELQAGLQELFATNQPVLPLSCSGSGAMQAAIVNLFNPKEKVLVVEGGKFGHRWSQIGLNHELEVISLKVPWGQTVDPDEIERLINKEPDIRAVLVQASETSTGVTHPIAEISEITSPKDILLIVDGISAVGISPCPMDKWGIDCLLTGSQKGIMLPPGLALISLSAKAWEKTKQVKKNLFYFDLQKEYEKSLQGQTTFSSPINLIMGLKESLELILKDGLSEIHRKYWSLTRMTRKGVEALGLELLATKNFTWGVTSILLPSGTDGQKILNTVANQYNVVLAGGQEHLKGKIVRIGHMGHIDWADILAGLYALKESLAINKIEFYPSENYLEQAMQAYEMAWEEELPF